MSNTLGIHWTVTTHGSWLHGDPRGSWKNGKLIGPDPTLHDDARLAMNGDVQRLAPNEIQLVADAIGMVCEQQRHRVLAAAVRQFHLHLLFAPLAENIETVVARLKRKMSMVVFDARRRGGISTPQHLWTSGRFVTFIYEMDYLFNTIEYVQRHNLEVGLPANPYDWIAPLRGGDI